LPKILSLEKKMLEWAALSAQESPLALQNAKRGFYEA
jgi:hypothetical protein